MSRVTFIEYKGYNIESAPKGFWVTREVEGEFFIVKTLDSIYLAKKFINDIAED